MLMTEAEFSYKRFEFGLSSPSVPETSNRMLTLFLLLFISPAVRGFGICATFDKIIS